MATSEDNAGTTIPDAYIVVFKKDITEDEVEHHMKTVTELLVQENKGHSVKHTYNIGTFRGYSAQMDDETLQKVKAMSEVSYVESDKTVSTCSSTGSANP